MTCTAKVDIRSHDLSEGPEQDLAMCLLTDKYFKI